MKWGVLPAVGAANSALVSKKDGENQKVSHIGVEFVLEGWRGQMLPVSGGFLRGIRAFAWHLLTDPCAYDDAAIELTTPN
ncbi:hypothetical protein SAMN06265222_108139 [Neorhodopirellula lusitana]|uniref:Uncharacterized protein n=1 Tax=Neorhodopirellula lusitana TaxID=445327 RepID=A0ABY1QB34_9BACT|nr:hypothetical protein SAMN06265222_108139 [Neorhodopirellula lusitana]